MPTNGATVPTVMVSSTFKDLTEHRVALTKALHAQDLHAVAMENDPAKPIDLITSSLEMVQKSAAYFIVIGHKYGQIPNDAPNNPDSVSLTELEFNKALELSLPIYLFVMSPTHPITVADVETDPEKIPKLNAFRERAKNISASSKVHRVYHTFNSLPDFAIHATESVADLRRRLDANNHPQNPAPSASPKDPLPKPPDLYAEPPYIGSHTFTGRQSQLDALNVWAIPADTDPIIFLDAIGGTGKSMLTWHWLNHHAPQIPTKWSGRLWYSFYERGAIMADFCRHALAYITGDPLETFTKQKTPELSKQLLHHLQTSPWLLVLDGIERILVAYNRYDAAQITDEQASNPTDEISNRNPTSAIRPEDDDLLRLLAAANPSKIVITSRLVPHAILNNSGQPIPGVLRLPLPGLRPADAEAMFRSCGITGDSQLIQTYLKTNYDCHPLVIGALAGLINNYGPDRGNFDSWQVKSGQLRLTDLNLVQKRNHILKTAIDGVPKPGHQILSLLSFFSESIDYETLRALTGTDPMSAITDLESRGLLQYEAKHYDLHPVVRAIVAEGLLPDERTQFGQQVVDHFSSKSHAPYEQAQTLEDVSDGLHVVRTLLKIGKFQQAADAYRGPLAYALLFNLEAHSEVLSLLKPFFPAGWSTLPNTVSDNDASDLANDAAVALNSLHDSKSSLRAYTAALESHLRAERWSDAGAVLRNIATSLRDQSRLAQETTLRGMAVKLASATGDKESIFRSLLNQFALLARIGRWDEAQNVWNQLDPMGRNWSRDAYLPGYAEFWFALLQFYQGKLLERHLAQAEELFKSGGYRFTLRNLHRLRGTWHIQSTEWSLAAESFSEAVAMARAVGQTDAEAETQLALARLHLNQLPDPPREANRLATAPYISSLNLAELYLAIGDLEQAKKSALAAYKRAWADGEPYVYRYRLNQSRALLEKLNVPLPDLKPYDPSTYQKFPWEDSVHAAIQKLRAAPRP